MNLLKELITDLSATNNTIVLDGATPSRVCVMTLKGVALIAEIAAVYGYRAKLVITHKTSDGPRYCIDCREDASITPNWRKIAEDLAAEVAALRA